MEIKNLVYISIFLMVISVILYYYVNYYIVKADNVNDNKSNQFVKNTKQNLENIEKKIHDYINPKETTEEVVIPKTVTKKDNVVPEIRPDVSIEIPDVVSKPIGEKNKSSELEDELKKVNDELLKLRTQINKQDTPTPNITKPEEKIVAKDEKLPEPAKPREEVFLIKNNIFSKNEGEKVCKALFNSKLATKEQLNDTYNNGANWCNYGWIDKSEAYYPLQIDTDTTTCLGKKGLNGGLMEEDLSLGVHCYGVKPGENSYYPLDKLYNDSSMSDKDIVMLENYKKKMNAGGIKIAPFNNNAWSKYSFKSDTIKIGDSIVVTEKNDKSKDPNTLKIEKVIVKELILPEKK
jgi:hypothetical protein